MYKNKPASLKTLDNNLAKFSSFSFVSETDSKQINKRLWWPKFKIKQQGSVRLNLTETRTVPVTTYSTNPKNSMPQNRNFNNPNRQ